jgi:hypothetical protein
VSTLSVTVKLRLPDGEHWYELCKAVSPEATAEVVRLLTRPDLDGPREIRLDVFRPCNSDAAPV